MHPPNILITSGRLTIITALQLQEIGTNVIHEPETGNVKLCRADPDEAHPSHQPGHHNNA